MSDAIRQTVEHLRELADRIESGATEVLDVSIEFGMIEDHTGFIVRKVPDGTRTLSIRHRENKL